MKLDQADYENIFLRIRERLIIQLIAAVSLILAIAGYTAWSTVKAKIEKITETAVNKYVQSDEFKKTVVLSYQEKMTRLESRTNDLAHLISEQQQLAAHLSETPILIDQNSLTLINKGGHKFRIEMGSANSGEKVLFKTPYRLEPAVFISIDGSKLDGIDIHRLQAKGTALLAVNSTPLGFEIPVSVYLTHYRWVALGQ